MSSDAKVNTYHLVEYDIAFLLIARWPEMTLDVHWINLGQQTMQIIPSIIFKNVLLAHQTKP